MGIPTLFFNASMTFALNLSSVWLIGKASGLVLTLAGVVKDVSRASFSFPFVRGVVLNRDAVHRFFLLLDPGPSWEAKLPAFRCSATLS